MNLVVYLIDQINANMETHSKLWYFENFNLLHSLNKQEIAELNQRSKMKETHKSDLVYCDGDNSHSIYFLKAGKIKISKFSDDGREIILNILGPGEIFGELALADQKERHNVAEVLEDSVICSVDIHELERLMKKNATFNLQITKFVGLKLRKVQSRLESLCFKNAEDRLKGFIKDMADEHGRQLINGTEVEIKLNLTHLDIAKLTATSRQKVSSVLSNLEKDGVIVYNRKRILVKELNSL